MVLQLRPKGPDEPVPPGSLFANPQRDIAHSLPDYVRKALSLTENEINCLPRPLRIRRLGELGDFAERAGKFVANCVGPDQADAVETLAEASGLLEGDRETERMFGRHFWRVVVSAYWAAARVAYATTPGAPVGRKEMVDAIEDLQGRVEEI